jgi:hypothetical protein
MIAQLVFFFANYIQIGFVKISCMTVYFLIVERIC